MIETPFLARQERFPVVGSTNDVVRRWLDDGEPEVCLAVADEQSAGRGREGRTWSAPAGRALLLSIGFRPSWLEPDRVWRLAATVSMAMADAAEEAAYLADRAVRLKWPNDLVIEDPIAGPPGSEATPLRAIRPRKLAGVLGETEGLGGPDPKAVIGIGVNADWPAAEFPPDLAADMTSLREASGGRPVELSALLDAFLSRLEFRIEALRAGRFDVGDYVDRQLTNGRPVRLIGHDGAATTVRALRVDAVTGALVVEDDAAPHGERSVFSGEIRHLRLGEAV